MLIPPNVTVIKHDKRDMTVSWHLLIPVIKFFVK